MPATLTTIDKILKEYYLPPVTEQLNNEILLLQRLESRDQELVGKQAIVPLHTSRSSAIGARPESDGTAVSQLPASGNQKYDRAVYDLKYLYGRVEVTGPSMVKSKNESGAFLLVLKGEIDGMRTDLKKDLARQIYGAGNAQIAQCGVSVATTTVLLSSDEALRKGDIYVGMLIWIGTTASPDTISGNGGRTVTDVDVAAKTITISGANVTTGATHFVFRLGQLSTDGATIYEIDGLQKIVPTAANTFGGINAAAAGNKYWDNLRLGNSGTARPLTLDLLQQSWSQQRIAGGETSALITSFGIQRAYFSLLQSQVRYNEPMNLKGGFTALDFMNKPLIADIQAPYGKVYFLDEKFIKVFSDRDWHFLDEDGNILKWKVGYDAWEAGLARYMNLGTNRRNTQLVLFDITDSGF